MTECRIQKLECHAEPEVTIDAEYEEASTGEEMRIGEDGGEMPAKDEL